MKHLAKPNVKASERIAIDKVKQGVALRDRDAAVLFEMKDPPPFVDHWVDTATGRAWALRLAWINLKRSFGLTE